MATHHTVVRTIPNTSTVRNWLNIALKSYEFQLSFQIMAIHIHYLLNRSDHLPQKAQGTGYGSTYTSIPANLPPVLLFLISFDLPSLPTLDPSTPILLRFLKYLNTHIHPRGIRYLNLTLLCHSKSALSPTAPFQQQA